MAIHDRFCVSEATAGDLLAAADDIVAVYAQAFATPPYNATPSSVLDFRDTLERHAGKDGFRAALARDASGALVGFSYGYAAHEDDWWLRHVREHLSEEQLKRWFSHCFEFVELAVLPSAQGHGLGGRLYDALLAGATQGTGALSTAKEETVAGGLYERRGWQTLVPEMYFPDNPLAYRVLVKDLR